MADSLKDQLLSLGFRASPAPKPKPAGKRKPKPEVPTDEAQIDLAKAFARRTRLEQRERAEAEKARQEAKRRKQEASLAVDRLLEGQTRNLLEADIARHFSYAGKIRRIYVDAAQLQQLNAGELGVVQHRGRYHLVTADVLAQVAALLPALVVPLGESGSEPAADGYEDPKYQVPDDLLW